MIAQELENDSPGAVLVFSGDGFGRCLYNETIPLDSLGRLYVKRLSYIEYDVASQTWQVKTAKDECLFSHALRSVCLSWEQRWFENDILTK